MTPARPLRGRLQKTGLAVAGYGRSGISTIPYDSSMRIAIVNDLSLAREVLRRLVLSVPGYSVAWVAEDGDDAVRMAAADRPDAILMDLVMPRLNGVEATRQIMKQSPCPILVVTATIPGHYELVIQAMGAGALDAVETPVLGPGGAIQNGNPLLARLAKFADASRGAAWAGVQTPQRPVATTADRPMLVVIGSSTGGPDALAAVLSALPTGFPAAVVIVQHIAAEFAPSLAQWLARAAACRCGPRETATLRRRGSSSSRRATITWNWLPT